MNLLEPLTPKTGRILYADNFYSSIDMAEKLYKMNILYCGTLRVNRKGVPEEFKNKMKKGEIKGKQKGNIKIIKWVDKRPVLMLSTFPEHDATLIDTGKGYCLF